MRITTAAVLAASLLAPTTIAQAPALHMISDGATAPVRMEGQFMSRVAMDLGGNLWAFFFKSGRNRLFKSTDDGLTWTQAALTQTKQDTYFSAVKAGPDCRFLHCAWNSANTQPFWYTYYQRFDTVTEKWEGSPTVVATGVMRGTENWKFQDLEVTPKGGVVIVAHTFGTVAAGLQRWAAYVYPKPAGVSSFGVPILVHPNSGGSGRDIDMVSVGETVHMAFRTITKGANTNLAYRALDMEAVSWVDTVRWLDGPMAGGTSTDTMTFGCSISADDAGNLYIAYGSGGISPAMTGKIKAAYASAPYTAWATSLVADDPPMTGGVRRGNFTLAKTTGASMHVVYSKESEGYNNIYSREMANGAFTSTTERTLITSTTRKFANMWGMSAHESRTGLMAVVQDDATTGRALLLLDATVDPIWGRGGQVRYIGHGCQGSLGVAPRIGVSVPPTVGRKLDILIADAPATTNGLLALGVTCPPVFDLTAIGAPGCALFQDTLIILGYMTDASGGFKLSGAIPGTAKAVALKFQSGVIAPGANVAGIVFTRSMSIHP